MTTKEERKEVAETYDGQLPDYLTDYFDEKELKEISQDYFNNIRKIARETSKEDRLKYRQELEELKKSKNLGLSFELIRTASIAFAE